MSLMICTYVLYIRSWLCILVKHNFGPFINGHIAINPPFNLATGATYWINLEPSLYRNPAYGPAIVRNLGLDLPDKIS